MRRLQSGGIPAGRRHEPVPRVSVGMVQSQQRIPRCPYTSDPAYASGTAQPAPGILRRGHRPEAVRERALRIGRGFVGCRLRPRNMRTAGLASAPRDAGSFQGTPAHLSSCPSGHERAAPTTQTECPAGLRVGGETRCGDCPRDSTSHAKSSAVSACALGQHGGSGSIVCQMCAAGRLGRVRCLPVGWHRAVAKDASTCLACHELPAERDRDDVLPGVRGGDIQRCGGRQTAPSVRLGACGAARGINVGLLSMRYNWHGSEQPPRVHSAERRAPGVAGLEMRVTRWRHLQCTGQRHTQSTETPRF